MTLKEAIAEINKKAGECRYWDLPGARDEVTMPDTHYAYFDGRAAGMREALEILAGVDKDDMPAQVKRWQAEALVRMMSPATKHDRRVYHDGEVAAYANVLRLVKGEAQ